MGTFSASLKTLGDRRGLPATINLEDDVLSITAGDQEIGTWTLKEITLEPTASGYRMAAEGEQILIEMPEKDVFAEELNRRSGRGLLPFRRKEKTPSKPKSKAKAKARTAFDQKPTPHTPVSYQLPVHAPQAETRRQPPVARAEPTVAGSEPESRLARLAKTKPSYLEPTPVPAEAKPKADVDKPSLLERIDGILAAGEKRWGSLMPNWFFTRMMFYIVVGAFLLMLIFPGLVSTFLLAAGMLMVVVGAIVYTDDVLASKWLPGRMTPSHVLIFGVAVLMFGVLLGVITR